MRERRVAVATENDTYDVFVAPTLSGLGEAVCRALPSAKDGVVVVTDDHVAPHWLQRVRAELEVAGVVVLAAGEAHKSWTSLQRVVDGVLAGPVHRRMPVIAVGGGVVGDVAGLGASLVMRGLPVVQVPTSLLAMVDASVGGKTAINHAQGKNLVGSFHHPSLVWTAMETLRTLPNAERIGGYGEVLKTAVVRSPQLLEQAAVAESAWQRGDSAPLAELVVACVKAKAWVVRQDALETGIRVWLNAGHTVGHALETAAGHGALHHGQAVAMGLVAETRWAIAQGICLEAELPHRLVDAMHDVGIPWDSRRFERTAAIAAMGLDKKGTAADVLVPVPIRAGTMTTVSVKRADLPSLLDGIID